MGKIQNNQSREVESLLARIAVLEEKLKEKDGQQSQALFHAIVENIPDMVFVKNAKDFRFVLVNKAGEELIGYQRHELIGRTDYDFFPQEEADFFPPKIMRC